ncbi:MAG: hypothetical protein JXR37_13000 [Kiritimatiellae bacterium]|nr:hypothetical protein [Kiritimatiellia bacterium]
MATAPAIVNARCPVCFDPCRLHEARARLRAEISGEVLDRRPLIFMAEGCRQTAPKDVMALDNERALDVQVARMNHFLAEFPEGDCLPFFTMTELGQAIIPSMFGLEVIVEDTQPPYTRDRIIRDPDRDLPRLPKRIDPEIDGWGPRLRERLKRFLEATDYKIPVPVADHQSPYGVATKLIGNEDLMIAMYTAPGLVHELMDRATHAIRDVIRAMQRWAGDPDLIVLNPHLPFPGNGLIVWDDYISVISPDLHAEFCRPYNMRLYQEFGLGHLHTCGPYFPHFLDALLAHDGLLSVDISFNLRGSSRTRADMLELRRRTREAGVALAAAGHCLAAFDRVWQGAGTPPDPAFMRRMADGKLLWTQSGTRAQGLQFLEWLSP